MELRFDEVPLRHVHQVEFKMYKTGVAQLAPLGYSGAARHL